MKVLVFDTETTGLPLDHTAPVNDSSKWPHIIQLGFIVFDTTSKEILEYSDSIIQLDESVEITPASISIHQITAQRSQSEGILMKQALQHFADCIKDVDVIVGHNIIFDKRMLMVEFHRNNVRNCFYRNGKAIPDFCTMKRSIDLCKIPTINKMTGEIYNKWPTLTELHVYLYGEKPKGTHNAIADVMICLRCYVQMEHKMDIALDNDVKLVFRSLFASYCIQ
jgi:DNA polymerase III epsilon subunit-like protein